MRDDARRERWCEERGVMQGEGVMWGKGDARDEVC